MVPAVEQAALVLVRRFDPSAAAPAFVVVELGLDRGVVQMKEVRPLGPPGLTGGGEDIHGLPVPVNRVVAVEAVVHVGGGYGDAGQVERRGVAQDGACGAAVRLEACRLCRGFER